jgi:hypothetical protein
MRLHKYLLIGGAVVLAAAATSAVALGASQRAHAASRAHHVQQQSDQVRLGLTPSSPGLATCMPGSQLNVRVDLTTDQRGFDRFEIAGRHLPPNRDFTIFLLEQAGAPFGAAQYIGDFSTDAYGNAHNNLRLIVGEAFASTIVNGTRTRVDLNRIGVWFADPVGDDFCLGAMSPSTPFDGDNSAGVQAFNSANALPLPAP